MGLIELGKRLRSKKIILSFSSGNPLVDSSGTSKVILRDQRIFLSSGMSYLLLFPVCVALGKDVEARYIDFRSYGVVADGSFVGIFSERDIRVEFGNLVCNGFSFEALHIHHLIRNDLRRTSRLLSVFDVRRVVVYLHDYYLVCSKGLNLINENASPCPLVVSDDCASCPKSAERLGRLEEITAFFVNLGARVVALAPSVVAARIWEKYGPFPVDEVVVLPHQRLSGEYKGNREKVDPTKFLSVGFVGAQRSAKGWELWKRLLEETPRGFYEFIQFGSGPESSELFTQVPVFTHKQGKDAMVLALRRANLNVALLLSNWPETYSYTAFECLASGAFIVTLEGSGNIAEMVRARHCGIVCKDGVELIKLLHDKNRLVEMVNAYRSSDVLRPEVLDDSDGILAYAGGDYALGALNLSGRVRRTYVDSAFAALASLLYKRKYASL